MLICIIAWLTDLSFKSIQAEKLSQRVGNMWNINEPVAVRAGAMSS